MILILYLGIQMALILCCGDTNGSNGRYDPVVRIQMDLFPPLWANKWNLSSVVEIQMTLILCCADTNGINSLL